MTTESKAKQTIDKSPLFLVMALRQSGSIDLLSIDSEEWIARKHKGMIETSAEWGVSPFADAVRVWVETRARNHLFAASMMDPDTMAQMFNRDELRLIYGTDYPEPGG